MSIWDLEQKTFARSFWRTGRTHLDSVKPGVFPLQMTNRLHLYPTVHILSEFYRVCMSRVLDAQFWADLRGWHNGLMWFDKIQTRFERQRILDETRIKLRWKLPRVGLVDLKLFVPLTLREINRMCFPLFTSSSPPYNLSLLLIGVLCIN